MSHLIVIFLSFALYLFTIHYSPFINPVLAHGFGQRIDLPIPLNLYIQGAIFVVVLSFFLFGFLSEERLVSLKNYPKFKLLNLSSTANILVLTLKCLSVGLFILLILAGFFGNQDPLVNITPTFIWVIFAVGMTFFSALFGNIWEVINPWKNIFQFLKLPSLNLTPSKRLGVLIAVIFYMIFKFIENSLNQSSAPSFLATLLSFYSIVTFTGMFIYGQRWLLVGEPFTILFNLLSKFSIIEVEKKEQLKIFLRPPIVGLLKKEDLNFSMVVFILLMLSTLSFDGIKELELGINFFYFFYKLGFTPYLINLLGIIFLLLIFTLIYLIFIYLMKFLVKSSISTKKLAVEFIYSLLPIAVVYEVAHYLVLFLIEGQRAFKLIQDPFGFSNLPAKINYSIDFIAIWNIQASLIVLGHIGAVFLSHLIAKRVFKDKFLANKSQYPMLVLMIIYTMFSLWILAQPLVSGI